MRWTTKMTTGLVLTLVTGAGAGVALGQAPAPPVPAPPVPAPGVVGVTEVPVISGPVSAWPEGYVIRSSGDVAQSGGLVGSIAAVYGDAPAFRYSYHAAFPLPARSYVGLGGPSDFPFYGEPYGSPNDRWTWDYMGGRSRLARYYYPPVP